MSYLRNILHPNIIVKRVASKIISLLWPWQLEGDYYDLDEVAVEWLANNKINYKLIPIPVGTYSISIGDKDNPGYIRESYRYNLGFRKKRNLILFKMVWGNEFS